MMTRREWLAASSAATAAAEPIPELCMRSAVELAALLRAKKVSAREVLAAHLKRIEDVNPKVNAIVTLVPEIAQQMATVADESAAKGRFLGPLHGLPIAHKDLRDTKGIRTTYGSPIYKDHIPDRTVLALERIQRAGAIVVGKTNVPEFGAGSHTFNPVFGATKNPYNLEKTCGGSSGGAAVALATRMIPIADGSDTGGSLRNPASFCSVVGFRNSPGRVPNWPSSTGWNMLSVVGAMARSVDDTALLLSTMAGPDPRVPLSIHEPGSIFMRPLNRDFTNVRVAWCPRFAGLPFAKSIVEVIESQLKTVRSLRVLTEDARFDVSEEEADSFKILRWLNTYQARSANMSQHRALIKETILEEYDAAAKLTGPEIMAAEVSRSRLFARFGQFMERYEFVLLPVTQVPPFDIKVPYITEIEGVKMKNYIDWMRSCWYITLTGHPAISVPAGFTEDGLPVGLQIVGRHHDDFGVLQFAKAFEQARGPLALTPAL